MSLEQIREDRLTFSFPASSQVAKYDDWAFYRKQFNAAFGGTKAVDIVYITNETTWLIEVKDYRANRRTKVMDLGLEVSTKVRDTIVGLMAAKCYANNTTEKKIAKSAISKNKIRVVLHLEQPARHSKLFPKAINVADVQMKLKQLLKPIDAHPIIVHQNNLRTNMDWSVTG